MIIGKCLSVPAQCLHFGGLFAVFLQQKWVFVRKWKTQQ